MRYYMSKHTGKLFTERQIKIVNDIYGKDELKDCLETKSIIPVEAPTVIDFLESENLKGAISRYEEIHDCELTEAYNMVKRIERDMERFKNPKHTCKNCGFECGSKCTYPAPCENCSEWVPKYN